MRFRGWKEMMSAVIRGIGILLSISATSAYAEPYLEELGRLRLNWGELTYRYYGEASWPRDGEKPDAAALAWSEGFSYLRDEGRRLSTTRLASFGASDVASDPAAGSRSVNTVYYGDGRVRVFLENKLTQLFPAATIGQASLDLASSSTSHTAVVIQVEGAFKPRPTYEIRDENGSVLCGPQMVSRSIRSESMMGRWFARASGPLFAELTGKAPVKLSATAGADHLIINRQVWDRHLAQVSPLLASAKVLLVVTRP